MADLLTHVLAAYILATVLSWRYEWLTPPYVTVAMAGAITPDLNRLELLVPAAQIQPTLGVPFSWDAFHTLGGTAFVAAIGAMLVPREYRLRVLALILLGALSHHALDLLLINPSGHSYEVFFPVSQYHPPTPNLYRSSDRWPALVAGGLATVVWAVDRWIVGKPTEDRSPALE